MAQSIIIKSSAMRAQGGETRAAFKLLAKLLIDDENKQAGEGTKNY